MQTTPSSAKLEIENKKRNEKLRRRDEKQVCSISLAERPVLSSLLYFSCHLVAAILAGCLSGIDEKQG